MHQMPDVVPLASTPKKRGRPNKPYRTSWGENIEGLRYRKHDQRWMVVATGAMYRERDERLAVANFRALEAKGNAPKKVLVEIGRNLEGVDAMKQALASTKGNAFVFRINKSGKVNVQKTETFDRPEYWHWLNQQLVSRADWVSERVGLDLTNLKPPAPSVKLSTLIDTYTTKPKLSPNEASRSKLFWAEFTKAVDVAHIGEIGHQQVIHYEKVVLASNLAAKSVHHRFAKVKTIIAYGLKRGMDIEGCRRALDACQMLEIQNAHSIDPTPITKDNFWKIYNKAKDAGDDVFATLMLTALCTCSYGGEVASMKWSEVDLTAGTYVGRRPKTKISRVATLWPELVAALNNIPKRDGVDYIFNTKVRSFTTFSVLEVWRRYREASGIDNAVTFGNLRDAAYSIACQSGSLDMAKVLAGHRFSGASDFYVRRRPDFVAGACEAIRIAFGVAEKV